MLTITVLMDQRPSSQDVVDQIQLLEDWLNGLEMMPATRLYRNAVLLGLLSKALTVGRAVCLLAGSGFPAEAFGLSRTIIEIYFSVRYIGNKDTEARAETYVNYHARVRKEWLTVIMKYYPNTPAGAVGLDKEVIETASAFKSKAHWTGHGGQAKLMALEEDFEDLDVQGQPTTSAFDYDALYFWTSQYVHATVVGIEAHACEPEQIFKVWSRKQVDVPRGADAIFNVVVFLAKIFARACRAMNEEQPGILDDLEKIANAFARVKANAL